MIGASVKRLLFAVLAAAILACFLPSYSLFTRDLVIDAGAIEKHGEFSYLAKLPFSSDAVMAADGPNSPFASTVILYENGKRIGWPHSLHEVIDKVGLGTFSHWGNLSESVLIFSSSDNTDPRTNGRSYRIAALHKAPNPVFILLALPLLVFLLDRAIGEKWMPLFQTLSIAGLLAIWVNLLHGFIAYYPDSLTYYYWLRIVPLGYCLFLGAVGSLVWVTDVQLFLLWGAILFLCLAVNQINTAAGLATLILLASSTHSVLPTSQHSERRSLPAATFGQRGRRHLCHHLSGEKAMADHRSTVSRRPHVCKAEPATMPCWAYFFS